MAGRLDTLLNKLSFPRLRSVLAKPIALYYAGIASLFLWPLGLDDLIVTQVWRSLYRVPVMSFWPALTTIFPIAGVAVLVVIGVRNAPELLRATKRLLSKVRVARPQAHTPPPPTAANGNGGPGVTPPPPAPTNGPTQSTSGPSKGSSSSKAASPDPVRPPQPSDHPNFGSPPPTAKAGSTKRTPVLVR